VGGEPGARERLPLSTIGKMKDTFNQNKESDLAASNPQAKKNSGPAFRIDDRRVSALADSEQAAVESDRSPFPSFVQELMSQTKQAEMKLAEKIQWMDEEISRTRERLAREQERTLEAEKKKIIQMFLELGDHFERALASVEASPAEAAHMVEGLKLIQAIFLSKLQLLGASPMKPLGQAFDPNLCEAVMLESVADPEKDQTVLEVLETGYIMGDQILRPARVKVAAYVPS
jgi:molecular chaperone GrpE